MDSPVVRCEWRPPPRPRFSPAACLAAAALLLVSCLAPRSSDPVTASENPDAVTVSVRSELWDTADIYLYCGGERVGLIGGVVMGRRG